MIEFKQIIGRGTRTFDGNYFSTIYDFVRAHEHFRVRSGMKSHYRPRSLPSWARPEAWVRNPSPENQA
jgi:type I restriction enzyme R subunit